jgi:hypothetical protein
MWKIEKVENKKRVTEEILIIPMLCRDEEKTYYDLNLIKSFFVF